MAIGAEDNHPRRRVSVLDSENIKADRDRVDNAGAFDLT